VAADPKSTTIIFPWIITSMISCTQLPRQGIPTLTPVTREPKAFLIQAIRSSASFSVRRSAAGRGKRAHLKSAPIVCQWPVCFTLELSPLHTSIYLFSWGNGKAALLSTHLWICPRLRPCHAKKGQAHALPVPACLCQGTRWMSVVKTQIMEMSHMTFHLFKLANCLNFDHMG